VRQRYVRHKPEQALLYPIIEEHAQRLFAERREQSDIVIDMRPAAIVGIAVGSAIALWLSHDALRIVFGVFFCYMGSHIARKGLCQ
jgi:uncharacterized membrane protein YfcA